MGIVFCKFKSIYAVVNENGLSVLESKVNKKLNEGWLLQGGIHWLVFQRGMEVDQSPVMHKL